MKITIQLVIETEGTTPMVVEAVASFTRAGVSPATLGLHLAEAKHLLQNIQEAMVMEQVTEYLMQQRPCPDCGKHRARKSHHTLLYRTLFGKLPLPSPNTLCAPVIKNRSGEVRVRLPDSSQNGVPLNWCTWKPNGPR